MGCIEGHAGKGKKTHYNLLYRADTDRNYQ